LASSGYAEEGWEAGVWGGGEGVGGGGGGGGLATDSSTCRNLDSPKPTNKKLYHCLVVSVFGYLLLLLDGKRKLD